MGTSFTALKASNIFDKYVGETEGKITRALSIAEAIAPCVLWVDEIEKLLAALAEMAPLIAEFHHDLGGTILTWMSDKNPVFVVATANNPERLEPCICQKRKIR